jgi:hypothetical protein
VVAVDADHMVDAALTLLLAVLAVQFPIAVLVYIDARRLGLATPRLYAVGIVVTNVAGVFVILYYLSKRRELPRADGE